MPVLLRASFVALTILLAMQTARANDTVHVGKAQGTAWTFLPVDIGIEQGIFAKQGLDVDSANLGGDAKVQQALVAGSIDFGLGSGPGMAFAAKGSPAIGVAAIRRSAAQHLGDRARRFADQESRRSQGQDDRGLDGRARSATGWPSRWRSRKAGARTASRPCRWARSRHRSRR